MASQEGESFLGRMREELTRFLTRRVACPDTAADLTEETLLKWLVAAPAVAAQDRRAYLFRIAANLVHDAARRRRIRPTRAAPETCVLRIPDPAPTPEQVVLTRQELAILQQAVDELPPRCREVFVLARLEGLTYAQIGTRLGISPKTAFSHTVKALAHLHSRLEQAQRI